MPEKRDAGVTRVARRQYWREDDARIVVNAWRRSGQRLIAFARAHEVHPRRLARWARRLESASEERVSFHPVRLVHALPPGVGGDDRIEIVLGDGRSIRIPRGCAPEDLRRVLDVLGMGAPC